MAETVIIIITGTIITTIIIIITTRFFSTNPIYGDGEITDLFFCLGRPFVKMDIPFG